MWIGIDDTDSLSGGCTTHLGAKICSKFNVNRHPWLIRLNPNIPYKTRGNGAVAININSTTKAARKYTLDLVKKESHASDPKTNPGVVFIMRLTAQDKKKLSDFYSAAVSRMVGIDEAEKLAQDISAEIHKFKNGRGIIGALAAIGAAAGGIMKDRTYELIAYRGDGASGLRKIDAVSVLRMNDATYPRTYDNVDTGTGRILINPRGRDPVFCGIRGETPFILGRAWRMIKPLEKVSFVRLFATNQGTDCHVRDKMISDIRPYDCVSIEGVIIEQPRTIAGGHVFFRVSDNSGSVWCAAYKPTGCFRDVVRNLHVGDYVRCLGGVGKYPATVNLEKIRVDRLAPVYSLAVPYCCGRKMTSAGRLKGFKCRVCSRRVAAASVPAVAVARAVCEGWYEVPPRSRRHLSRPLVRGI
jgi:tRNA(Ile2)-agmatinylcytidine synthase